VAKSWISSSVSKRWWASQFITYGPVIALDVSFFAGADLDEIGADSALCSPSQRHLTDVFRAVIAADGFRFAAPFDDLVERTNHAFGWQREVDLDPETLAVEIIDDVEQPDAGPVGKLIVHEVHRPALVHGPRHCQRQRLFAHQAMARLDLHVQLKLAINPVDALVVPFEASHVTQVQEARTAPPKFRWLFVNRTSQSVVTSYSASSLAF
jgi:hypothetical protein